MYVEKGRIDSVMILATIYQVAKMLFLFPAEFSHQMKMINA